MWENFFETSSWTRSVGSQGMHLLNLANYCLHVLWQSYTSPYLYLQQCPRVLFILTNIKYSPLSNFASLMLSAHIALFNNLNFYNNQWLWVSLHSNFWVSTFSFLYPFTSTYILLNFMLGLQSCWFAFYVLNPFSVLGIANTFLHSVIHLLTLSIVSFVEQKSLCNQSHWRFSCGLCFWCFVIFFRYPAHLSYTGLSSPSFFEHLIWMFESSLWFMRVLLWKLVSRASLCLRK